MWPIVQFVSLLPILEKEMHYINDCESPQTLLIFFMKTVRVFERFKGEKYNMILIDAF